MIAASWILLIFMVVRFFASIFKVSVGSSEFKVAQTLGCVIGHALLVWLIYLSGGWQ